MSRIFKETAKQPNPVQLMNLIGNRNYDRAVWAFCNHRSRINAAQARLLETEKAYRSETEKAHQAASQAVSHTGYRSAHQAAKQAAQASVYTSVLLMSFRTTLLINKYS